MNEGTNTIGAKIRRLRLERGWSVADLAARSGYTRQGIDLIEKRKTGVSRPGQLAIAAALGVDVGTLHKRGRAA
jgi:transcriptional regulator with XRE-family HTH domain